jgi:hypothetical protein
MRRVGLVLAISAVALAVIPGPARAQTEEPALGCIPTSDTPFQTDLVGPLPFGTALIMITAGLPNPTIEVGTVNPDGTASFRAGIAPGTYAVVLVGRHGEFLPQGSLQIGNCTPKSKEQCKNGGWHDFDFENQGRCIAFVSRGSKTGALEAAGLSE